MKSHKWTLKKGSTEFPDRFGGQEVEYQEPTETSELTAQIDKVLAKHNGQDPKPEKTYTREDILFDMSLNQGWNLNFQKRIKDLLNDESLKEQSVSAALAWALKRAVDENAGVKIPGTRRGEGKGSKVARITAEKEKVEKKAESAVAALEKAYLQMPKAARAAFAAGLVEQGILTKERLAELDAQK